MLHYRVSVSPETSTASTITSANMSQNTKTTQGTPNPIMTTRKEPEQTHDTDHTSWELEFYLHQQKESTELQNKALESMKVLRGHVQKTSENILG
uniref:Uncharacterized protein n=1 Tax=Bracon brevicornis TaxID=1563983 RepID=A0A6V7JX08_9HYME